MLAGFTAVTTFAGLFAAVPRLTATLVEPLLVQAVSQLVPSWTKSGPPEKGTSLVSVCEGSVREPSALKIVRLTS